MLFLNLYLDLDAITFAIFYAKSSFFPDYTRLPFAIHYVVQAALADSVGDARPFLSDEYLPERALCYVDSSSRYFTVLNVVPLSHSAVVPGPLILSDITCLAFFLYNIVFVHLIFLGFIFTMVIVTVISLLLSRNLSVRRQRTFDQNAVDILHSVKLI